MIKRTLTILNQNKKGFFLIFLGIGSILVSFQLILTGMYHVINYLDIYKLEKIEISGSLAPQTRKKILENPHLQKILNSKRSLLAIDTSKLEEILSEKIEIKKVVAKRKFPNTLNLFIEENDNIIILNTPRGQYAIDLNGKRVGSLSLNYNRFIVQLREKEDNERALTKNYLQRFLKEIKKLPKKEKDFFFLFSHLDYYRGRIHLYANNQPLTITWVDTPKKKAIRTARYATIYWQQKKMAEQGFNLVDISGKLIRYSKKQNKILELAKNN